MRYEISRFGHFLATRDKGGKLREDLEQQVRGLKPGDTVEVSFANVQGMTISFADEFIGRLFSAREAGDLPEVALIISGANDDVREALDICLQRRDGLAVLRRGRHLELIGATDQQLIDTYNRARALREFRASELAEDLGISPQNANNRLRWLVDAGALFRARTAPDHGGKEFIYRTPK